MKRKIYERDEIDYDTGEIKKTVQITTKKDERAFVQIYLSHIFTFFQAEPVPFNYVLALINQMDFADKEKPHGGQILYVNQSVLEVVSKQINKSVTSIKHVIGKMVKNDMMRRVNKGTYQFNPLLFGKGKWEDVENVVAQYDYKNRKVDVKFYEK